MKAASCFPLKQEYRGHDSTDLFTFLFIMCQSACSKTVRRNSRAINIGENCYLTGQESSVRCHSAFRAALWLKVILQNENLHRVSLQPSTHARSLRFLGRGGEISVTSVLLTRQELPRKEGKQGAESCRASVEEADWESYSILSQMRYISLRITYIHRQRE